MSAPPPFHLAGLREAWDRFFHTPGDPALCGAFRIAYAFLLLVANLVLWPDLERFFGPDGLVPYEVSREVVGPTSLTLFTWLPGTHAALWTAYLVYLVQNVLLLVGCCARFNAASVFLWQVSFQHRCPLVFDGEDFLFRLLGFLLIFLPMAEAYSFDAWWRQRRDGRPAARPARPLWALRLIQIEMTIVYLATALQKMRGEEWVDGTALYYVSRLDEFFFRLPLPSFPFEYLPLIKLMTWGVIAAELFIPIALWIRETRRVALLVALVFHLLSDYAMNLFLFHWIMLVGLMSFLQAEDMNLLKGWLARLRLRRVAPAVDFR